MSVKKSMIATRTAPKSSAPTPAASAPAKPDVHTHADLESSIASLLSKLASLEAEVNSLKAAVAAKPAPVAAAPASAAPASAAASDDALRSEMKRYFATAKNGKVPTHWPNL